MMKRREHGKISNRASAPGLHCGGLLLCLLLLPQLAAAQQSSTPVSVVSASRTSLYEEIPLSGTVLAWRVSRISPKLEGLIAEMLVDDGAEVEAGEIMLTLDATMAEIELSRARAALAEAAARLTEARRQRDEAQELVAKKHIAATDYAARQAEVDIRTAMLQGLRAELARNQETLSRHKVYAPFDGVIAAKLVEVGQWVQTSTALVELVEIDTLRVDVPVPQHFFGLVDVGTAARIRFDARPGQDVAGKVTMKIPVGDDSARTFPVRIEIDNDSRAIAPGMSARVYFRIKQATPGLLVPRDTIVKKPDGTELVWVLAEEDGVLKVRPVSVQSGKAYQGKVEIISGALNEGDRLVIRGNEILRPGQRVHISRELSPE